MKVLSKRVFCRSVEKIKESVVLSMDLRVDSSVDCSMLKERKKKKKRKREKHVYGSDFRETIIIHIFLGGEGEMKQPIRQNSLGATSGYLAL